jgi:hypothetical protein
MLVGRSHLTTVTLKWKVGAGRAGIGAGHAERLLRSRVTGTRRRGSSIAGTRSRFNRSNLLDIKHVNNIIIRKGYVNLGSGILIVNSLDSRNRVIGSRISSIIGGCSRSRRRIVRGWFIIRGDPFDLVNVKKRTREWSRVFRR